MLTTRKHKNAGVWRGFEAPQKGLYSTHVWWHLMALTLTCVVRAIYGVLNSSAVLSVCEGACFGGSGPLRTGCNGHGNHT